MSYGGWLRILHQQFGMVETCWNPIKNGMFTTVFNWWFGFRWRIHSMFGMVICIWVAGGRNPKFSRPSLGQLAKSSPHHLVTPVKKKLAGRKTSNNICIQMSNMNRKKPIIKNEMQHLGLKITSICHHQPVDIELKERSGNDGFAECVPVKCPRKNGSVFLWVSLPIHRP